MSETNVKPSLGIIFQDYPTISHIVHQTENNSSTGAIRNYLVYPESYGVLLLPMSNLLGEGEDHRAPGLGIVGVGVCQAERELRVLDEVTFNIYYNFILKILSLK